MSTYIPSRRTWDYALWLSGGLSPRDWEILRDVERLRLVTGAQIQRLHFSDLSEKSAPVVRWRVLKRLRECGALLALPRRIGGVRHGSAGMVFTLDLPGQRLIYLTRPKDEYDRRFRRREPPSERFMRHTLTVSELYVRLVEKTRENGSPWRVAGYQTEPACWWRDSFGGLLKPDAHLMLDHDGGERADRWRYYWWAEIDLGTEHVPTLVGKLRTYQEHYRHGGSGPNEVMPRVLVTVPTDARCAALRRALRRWREPAGHRFALTRFDDATAVLTDPTPPAPAPSESSPELSPELSAEWP